MRELLSRPEVNVNLATACMRPSGLTPLMFASMRGHLAVVRLLLAHPGLDLEAADSSGQTAVFHACNHGTHRVGDGLGYFSRLWSWDVSQDQLRDMEVAARSGAAEVVRLLVRAGADLDRRDGTGASVLNRAASVDRFGEVVGELVEAGCRPTENVLNWTRVMNPDMVAVVEEEMTRPAPLRRLARKEVWRRVREGSRAGGPDFRARIDSLEGDVLPTVLVDYLRCQHQ